MQCERVDFLQMLSIAMKGNQSIIKSSKFKTPSEKNTKNENLKLREKEKVIRQSV